MSKPRDRDVRIPLGPTPGVPDDFGQPQENTGQHVRVELQRLHERVEEAIDIDKKDHKMMTETMGQHGRDIRGLTGDVSELKLQITRVEGQIGRVEGKVEGIVPALNVMTNSIQQLGQQSHLRLEAHTEIDVAMKKSQIDDVADTRKKRRDIAYGVLKVGAIAIATWAIAHFTGLH